MSNDATATTIPVAIPFDDVLLVLRALLHASTRRLPASPVDVDLAEASVSLYAHALSASEPAALPHDPALHWQRLLDEAKAFLNEHGSA